MAAMLDDARRRGEALAGLLASESVIYGRFGFGHATTAMELSDRQPSGRSSWCRPRQLDLRLVDRDEAAKILPDLFDRLRRARAGEPSRDAGGLGGLPGGPARPAPRRPAGCSWRSATTGTWPTGPTTPTSCGAEYPTVVIEELRGPTPEVEAALWRFVFDLDLVGEVTAKRRPVDEPLRWRLADPRQLQVTVVRRPAVPAHPRRSRRLREPGLPPGRPARPRRAARRATSSTASPTRRRGAGCSRPGRTGRPAGPPGPGRTPTCAWA